jgi:hypothetical protein
VHELTACDKQQRLEFGVWAEDEEVTRHNVWFSDETHFHSDGIVNMENVCFWASGNPNALIEKMHHALKITVGIAIANKWDQFQ